MCKLPTGTVTLLFTDIEGSTRLLQQLGDRWVNVLADHNRLLGVAFAKHGGGEVSAEGDAFFVAFARAHDAIMAAGARCSRLARRCRAARAHGHPYRRADRGTGRLRRL
jgi:class 3 adenylate cyclase